jgi:uncharacterized membrane protein YuzA (DUF378 family)
MDARTPPNPGLFKWNLVTALFGGDVHPSEASPLSQVFYILVGLAGLALAFTYPWRGRRVKPDATQPRYEPPRREVPS